MHAVTAARDPLSHLPSGPCLVGFGASWCAPWQLLAPVLDRLAEDGIEVRRVDADRYDDHAERFRVICLPTFCLLRDGKEVRRKVGAVSEADLRELVTGRRSRRRAQ